jgi:hypothetical protein
LLVRLDVLEHGSGGKNPWIVMLVICVTIAENEVSSSHLSSVKLSEGHGVLDEAIGFLDGSIPLLWLDVALSESVSDLAIPALASNKLRINWLISSQVHVIPPSVEKVLVPLLIHSHVKHAVNRKMQSIC